MKQPDPCLADRSQRGISLVVVLVVVLMVSLLLLGSTRTAWLNERVVGSEADTQRAFAAAEALIKDAEMDILGMRADGKACPVNPLPTVCRSRTNGMGFFPQTDSDLDLLKTATANQYMNCVVGLCMPNNSTSMANAWRTPADLLAMQAVGATYGRFTGADARLVGNPLLDRTAPRAWYWIEVLRYSTANLILSGKTSLPVPKTEKPYIYRIHAIALGMRPGTQVYLRSVLVPDPME